MDRKDSKKQPGKREQSAKQGTAWKGRSSSVKSTRPIQTEPEGKPGIPKKGFWGSEGKLEKILQIMVDGVVIVNAAGQIEYANESAEKILGLSKDPVQGRNYKIGEWRQIDKNGKPFPPDQLPLSIALREQREVVGLEHGIVDSSGTVRWLSVNAIPLFDDRGALSGGLASFQDITNFRNTKVELGESEERYRALVENSPDLIARFDRELRMIYANPAVLQRTAMSADELLGRTAREYGAVETSADVWDRTARLALETGLMQNFEITSIWQGKPRLYDVVAVPERAADGSVVSVMSVARDITEKRRAEELVRESEARFRSTMDNMLEGCQIIGHDWRYIYVNDAAEKQNRRPKGELIGKRYMDMWPEIESTYVFSVIRRSLEERTSQVLENEFTYPDGTVGWFELSIQPVPEGVFILSEDITERKRIEAALQQSEERFKAIASHTPDHILVQDRDLRYTFVVNPQLGLTEKDMIGRTDFDFLTKEDAENLTRIKRQVLDTGKTIPVELPIASSKGEAAYFKGSYVPKYGTDGRIDGLIGYFQNVTELKRTEEKLQKLNRTLRALSNTSQAMMRAQSEKEYLEAVCKIIVEDCGHAMVWIGFKQLDKEKSVLPVASAGFEKGYLETLKITWADSERGRGPTGTAIRTGKAARCQNMLIDPQFAPWREQALKRGYASSIVLPLMDGRKVFGAVTIYAREPDAFSDDEEKLLTELAFDLVFGIQAIRTRAAHALAEAALRKSEERYHNLFNTMEEGFCVIEMIYDERGKPVDYRFLEVNGAFEKQTGLREARGKLMRELAPEHEPHWFEIYGKVALTGEPARFTNEAGALNRWYEVFAYRVGTPEDRQVAIVFNDITERKRAEEIQNWLASFPEINPSPIVELNYSGDLDYLNPTARILFPDMQSLGKKHPWLSGLEPVIAGFVGEKTTQDTRDVKIGDRTYQQVISHVVQNQRVRIYGFDITARIRAEEALRQTRDLLEIRVQERTRELEKTNEQLNLEIAERQRLADSLHDAVNQSLFSAGLIAEVLPRVWVRKPDQARQSLEDLRRLTRGAQSELRALLAELRPSLLTESNIDDLLRQLGNAFTGRTNVPVAISVSGETSLPANVQVVFYRICQESLTNIAKHSEASQVEISLLGNAAITELCIHDNGQGFTPELIPPGHYGLGMMRERAASVGAIMSIASRPGQGTNISLLWERKKKQEST